MAPTLLPRGPTSGHIRQVSRSISSSVSSADDLTTRSTSSLCSLASRSFDSLSRLIPRRSLTSSASQLPPNLISSSKRQAQILAIPTTYAGLNAGPKPGTVVGIVLGSIAGFLLILLLVYNIVNLSGNRNQTTTVIKERRRSPPRSESPSTVETRSETVEVRSNRSPAPRRQSTRRETIVVEERISRPVDPPREDDIIEVFEEHSPPRRPSKREGRRVSGGFRTVDPAEFGGGSAPMRKVSRK